MNCIRFVCGLCLAASLAPAQQYQIATVAGSPGTEGRFGDGGAPGTAELAFPTQLVLDRKGNLYIADYLNCVVREVFAGGEINTIEKLRTRLEYDLFYIDHWSPLFDLRILALTTLAVIQNANAY